MIKKLLTFVFLLGTAWGQVVHSAGREVPNVFTATNQFTLGAQVGPLTVATLPSPINGTVVYVSDATLGSNPCTSGGTGSLALATGGTWTCGFGGGGGGISGLTPGIVPVAVTATTVGNSNELLMTPSLITLGVGCLTVCTGGAISLSPYTSGNI